MQDSEQMELPLEPGLVEDHGLGLTDEEAGNPGEAPEEDNSDDLVEINDDEETEDDDG